MGVRWVVTRDVRVLSVGRKPASKAGGSVGQSQEDGRWQKGGENVPQPQTQRYMQNYFIF